jgi:hypothetical protein
MKNKTWLFILLVPFLTCNMVFAVNVNDIPEIELRAQQLVIEAGNILKFAGNLRDLKNNDFVLEVAGSTETITIDNPTKAKLLTRYLNLLATAQAALNAFPQ